MKKRKRNKNEVLTSELLSDLSFSSLGLVLIVFVVYSIIFNSNVPYRKIVELKNTISELETKGNSLESNIAKLTESNARISQEKAEVEKKNTELANSVKKLENQNTNLEKKVSSLSENNSELAKEKATLEQQKTALNQTNSNLRTDKNEAEEKAEKLERRLRQIKRKSRYTGYYIGNYRGIIYTQICNRGPYITIEGKQSIFYFQEANILVYSTTVKNYGTLTFEYKGTLTGNTFTGKPRKYSLAKTRISCNPNAEIKVRFSDGYAEVGSDSGTQTLRKVD
ncbi:MAG: hypothetical protein F6K40_16645 [Okeania sp. SIO3I5]|uniref:coiled-coil domain-containing protein n=1 Tax=Okeania sp. SIO3I5 TaxID=2607805 RepID=UPI0013B76194|nr:hypothetical protein [Okeania sp. SIO3I5]NEQ37798.1 hypothetical protein [Okeania sp. SIO3I5]